MKVIMLNSVSLDMAVKNFPVDMGLHYELVRKLKPDVYMFGSQTAISGLQEETSESKTDFNKPEKKKPYWVIIDSRGKLEFKLHNYRRSNFSGNIIVLVSKQTPDSYLTYLSARKYDYIVTGTNKVDYKEAFKLLEEKYDVETILVDSGGELNSYLFDQKLVDEISLLVLPFILGKNPTTLFREIRSSIKLELMDTQEIKNHLLLTYKVMK